MGRLGRRTYLNPVVAADYSDPDPIRVGDDYYLVASRFELSPGVSILHSKDLANWESLGGKLSEAPRMRSVPTASQRIRFEKRALWHCLEKTDFMHRMVVAGQITIRCAQKRSNRARQDAISVQGKRA
jgi:hypothetical protein